MKKRVIVSVISDVVTDQRVQKECNTLFRNGYDILVLGRKSERDFGLKDFPYKVIRLKNIFNRGPMMYLLFNVQLFFYLLFQKADILWANDLDTLLPNFLVSRLKNSKLVYDSHEYFTESVYKKSSRKMWERLENYLFPKLKNVITVNDSLKKVYETKYKLPVTVIRNVPVLSSTKTNEAFVNTYNKKVLIIQGMGINENRGAEEAIMMMQFLPDEFQLYFIGGGTIWNKLIAMTNELKLTNKIIFINALPYEEMMKYTRTAYLGLILEKTNTTHHHLMALPNKFFDYLQAGVPVLASKIIEVEKLIKKYAVGFVTDSVDPKQLASIVSEICFDSSTYHRWKKNTEIAAKDLNWENEEKTLINFMNNLQ